MGSHLSSNPKVEVAQVRMKKRAEAKGNREILDGINKGLNS
jgi:hypothetical protein